MTQLDQAVAGLEKNTHQGHFGELFVASIAAAAGYDLVIPMLGHGFDLQVFTRGPNGTSGSRQIAFQVKSWSVGGPGPDGCFHYPLKVSAYNYLAGKNDVRHYLALCIVPSAASEYTHARHSRLKLNHAAYWLSLKGMEPDEAADPDSTKTVLVPTANLLTCDTMRALVEKKEHLAVVR